MQRVTVSIAFAFLLIAMPGSVLWAQGMLPGAGTGPSVSTSTAPGTLLIGQKVPDSLIVTDANGTRRTLLSFKAPLEVLVVGFFSSQCATDRALRSDWRRFYERYREWRVSFLGVSASGGETAGGVKAQLAEAGMPIPVVRADPAVRQALGVEATPELLIIDESGYLRYRGPLHDAGERPGTKPKAAYGVQAIEAVIGHVEPVAQPEPGGFIGCPLP